MVKKTTKKRSVVSLVVFGLGAYLVITALAQVLGINNIALGGGAIEMPAIAWLATVIWAAVTWAVWPVFEKGSGTRNLKLEKKALTRLYTLGAIAIPVWCVVWAGIIGTLLAWQSPFASWLLEHWIFLLVPIGGLIFTLAYIRTFHYKQSTPGEEAIIRRFILVAIPTFLLYIVLLYGTFITVFMLSSNPFSTI